MTTTTHSSSPQQQQQQDSSSNSQFVILIVTSVVVVSASTVVLCWLNWRRRRDINNDTSSQQQQQAEQEQRRRIVLETIQQRRSIYPKQYYHNDDSTTNTTTSQNDDDDVRKNVPPSVPRAILDEMLEAARWAPTHHLTQPWYFIVFDTLDSRQRLGIFLAQQYRDSCTDNNQKPFSQAKYDKKIRDCTRASYVMAVCLQQQSNKHSNPVMEDISSVAMAVQNMHLVASTAQFDYYPHSSWDQKEKGTSTMRLRMGVGAYWSTSGIYYHDAAAMTLPDRVLTNPPALVEFLQLDPTTTTCLGWFFVGPYCNAGQKPLRGRRDPMNENKVRWM